MEFLDALLKTNTASGAEKNVADAIKQKLTGIADSISTDKCGNLIICIDGGEKDGKKETIAVFSAIDAPGLIATYIEDNGNVRVAPLGKCDFVSICHAKVTNGKITGILLPHSADSKAVTECYAYFGFKDGTEAKTHISQGDVLFFESAPVSLANSFISGVGAGTKACAAAVVSAAEQVTRQKGKCFYFVFTAQSELMLRGSYQAAYAVNADKALCLEPYLGKDFAVKVCDKSVVCDEALTEALEESAKQCSTDIKRYVSADGLSDASRVQCAGIGTKTASLLMPSNHLGTLTETVNHGDAEQLSRIILQFLNNI